MSQTKKFKNVPVIGIYDGHTDHPMVTTLSGYVIEGTHYNFDEYDVEFVVTKKVKPIADGTILHFKTWPYNIYVKNRGVWRYTDSRNVGLVWAVSSYNDAYIQESLDNGEATIVNEVKS